MEKGEQSFGRLQDGVRLGVGRLKQAISDVPEKPGVYRMLGASGEVLYVGKAKNLRKRLTSYTQGRWHSAYIPLVLEKFDKLELTVVARESDALSLEAGLIGELKPRYNVVMRSCRSFYYILISKGAREDGNDFPRLTHRRGQPKKDDYHFGPFPSYAALSESVEILEKVFLLRTCADHVFSNRSRPCLLYQIGRCCAPCVGYISHQDYAKLVEQAHAFFRGDNERLKREWKQSMRTCASQEQFERAGFYRDRLLTLESLTKSTKHGIILSETFEQADVFACHIEGHIACVQVFFFRSYRNLGNASFSMKAVEGTAAADVLSDFIPQFYQKNKPPVLILTHALEAETKGMIESTLNLKILIPKKGEKRRFVDLALENARQGIKPRQTDENLLLEMARFFSLSTETVPQRTEIYDNSHIQGAYPVGGMVVYTPSGFVRDQYRIFNMRGNHRGDDLSMMTELFSRRFRKTGSGAHSALPDLIIVDGGATQLQAACQALKAQGVDVPIVAIAKGKDRNAGRERFFLPHMKEPLLLQHGSPLMHFLQRLRDEAHRFAITAHRRRRHRFCRPSTRNQRGDGADTADAT